MKRWTSWGVACLVAALITVNGSAQDKEKDPKADPKKPMAPAPKVPDMNKAQQDLVKTGTLAGEIVHVESGKQAFRVKVAYQYSEFNQGAYNNMVQQQIHLQQALARRDVNAARNHQIEMLKNQAQLYSLKTAHREFALDAHEKMTVRLPSPKAVFDEMGNVKKYTAEELKKLRGKDNLFDGEFSDLSNGQIVQVTIVLPKAPAKPVRKDDLALEDNKIEATRVAVLRQPIPR